MNENCPRHPRILKLYIFRKNFYLLKKDLMFLNMLFLTSKEVGDFFYSFFSPKIKPFDNFSSSCFFYQHPIYIKEEGKTEILYG